MILGVFLLVIAVALLGYKELRKTDRLWLPGIIAATGVESFAAGMHPPSQPLIVAGQVLVVLCGLACVAVQKRLTGPAPANVARRAVRIIGLLIVLGGGAIAASKPDALLGAGAAAVLIGGFLWFFARERNAQT